MNKKIMLSAIQPSNKLTLGNYLGAIKQWVKQQAQYQCYFFVVDMHAITVPTDPAALQEQIYEALAYYIASGIDPDKCTLFVQSHVPQHAELAWILNCHTSMGELNRMTQFKDKSANGKHVGLGLYTYPVLMAADILLYNTDLVPVGADQKQHVELTRDLAIRMNNKYGDNTFKVPTPFIPKQGARIMSLQNPLSKMSKSDPDNKASIFLNDSPKQVEKKFKKAITDSGSSIIYNKDDAEKAGINNLLEIQATITGNPIKSILQSYEGKMYGHLKVETAQIVNAELEPIQKEALKLLADKAYLNSVMKKGADKAREHASKTIKRVYEKLGFITY